MGVLAFAALLVGLPSFAQDEWGGWRGPERTGRAPAFRTPETWPRQLELVWHVAVGLGHAGPVVAGETVCLHARVDEDEVVSCHDLGTGRARWTQSYPAPFDTGIGAGHHGAGPKATPALHDGRLFTFGISGVLSAWSVETGDLLWRRDFRRDYDKPWPYWGVASSPLVLGDRVYVHAGRQDGGLHALDAASGDELWKLEEVSSAYSSPVLAELDGVQQIVTLSRHDLLGVATDGELLWRYEHSHRENAPTPVVLGDKVFLTSKKQPVEALEPRRGSDGRWTATRAWANKEIPLHLSSLVAPDEGRVCGLSHRKKGFAFCAAADDGTLLWRSPNRYAASATAISVPGALLFVATAGELVVIDDGDTFREIARYGISDSEVWAHPAILPDALVVKSYDELLVWRVPR